MSKPPDSNKESTAQNSRLNVLLIAPYYDKNVAGESWSTFKWIEGISKRHNVTVLTTHKKGWDPATSPTHANEIINWPFSSLPASLGRLA